MTKQELFKKYADVLNKPLGKLTDKEWKKFNQFLDESSKAGLTDEEIYDGKTNA